VSKRVSEQDQRLATVLTDSNDAVTVHDFEGRITAWNRGAARMYGYTDAQALGINIQAIVPKAREAEAMALLERLALGEEIESYETQRVTRDGRVLDVWLTITTLRDESGTPIAVATTERDVTKRNQAEQQLREDQRRLRSLASELSLAEERERRRIASVLHDQIGGTLSAAKIRLGELRQAAAATALWQPLSEIRELIEKAIESTRSLTFDLASPILYEVGLEAALESLADKIQERYGIERHFEDDGLPKPMGDESRIVLYHAVRELLANVARHAHATSVHVSVRRDGACVRVDVEDDGVGFEVPKTGFRVSRSGGFGLFHVDECLKHLGGRLEMHSQPGRGTAVTVVAPLIAESPASDTTTP
jgi:PAS domain S-box-containing protein